MSCVTGRETPSVIYLNSIYPFLKVLKTCYSLIHLVFLEQNTRVMNVTVFERRLKITKMSQ